MKMEVPHDRIVHSASSLARGFPAAIEIMTMAMIRS